MHSTMIEVYVKKRDQDCQLNIAQMEFPPIIMGWRIEAALNQKPIGCLYSLAKKNPIETKLTSY